MSSENNLLSQEDLAKMEEELKVAKEKLSIKQPEVDVDKLREEIKASTILELKKEQEAQAEQDRVKELEQKVASSDDAMKKLQEMEERLKAISIGGKAPSTTGNPFKSTNVNNVDEMTPEDIHRIDESSKRLFFDRRV